MGTKTGERPVPRTPAGARALAWTGCPMSAYRHVARKLMDEWRAGQGRRAANGVTEVMRALEFIAQPIADMEARKENPQPVALTRKQVRIAQHRAISARRRIEHGPPDMSAEVWWEQIEAIAKRWGISTTQEEWTAKKEAKKAAA